jgi:Abnormal spindle-like microcephaly-assoc'd, ASPM-SPD-2-Hydin
VEQSTIFRLHRLGCLVAVPAILIIIVGCQGISSAPKQASGGSLAVGQVAVAPSTMSFGSVAVGSNAVLKGTLTAGTSDITVSSITVSSAAGSPQGYSLSGISFPVTVPAGQSVPFTVTFAPHTAGTLPGSIDFNSNATNSPTMETLTGSGTQPDGGTTAGQLAVAPTTMNFGNVAVGSNSFQPGTLTAGSSDIKVISATWNGQGYSLSGISFPVTVPAGQSVPFTVTFAPQTAGSTPGSITFDSNATNSPNKETLTGGGTQQSQHSVALSWDASTSQVIGYNVYRGIASGGPYTKLNMSVDSSTAYTDNSVRSGQSYYYVITAVDSSNVESAYSNQVTALVP